MDVLAGLASSNEAPVDGRVQPALALPLVRDADYAGQPGELVLMVRLVIPPTARQAGGAYGGPAAPCKGSLILAGQDGAQHLLGDVVAIRWDGSALTLDVDPVQTREDQGQMFSSLAQPVRPQPKT
jgi:hypothetical protein